MASDVQLSQVLVPDRVLVLHSGAKTEVLRVLADSLGTAPQVQDRDALIRGILYREELMSTGIGTGIAVPHVRLASVTDPVMSAGVCRPPITDYESLDGVPVHLIFMIAAGQYQHTEYLRLLSSLSLRLKSERLRDALVAAQDTLRFYDTLTRQED